ncbi:MAG: aspartyl/asparaginyl beta-hydroxylase domain-containing protein [Chakrabartia sp.]
MTEALSPEALEAKADQASAAGDLVAAQQALEELVAVAPSAGRWFKLGSVRAARGQVRPALAAVEQGLALAPLDFMGLLSRASLLERLQVPGFGEAFGRALAQRPEGPLPTGLARMLAHAQSAYDAFCAQHDAELQAVLAPARAAASAEEQRRMDRFRTNALRTTRVFHSEPSHFHYPGLVEREFHDDRDFPWLAELEAMTDIIRDEYLAVASRQDGERVPYIRYAEHEPLRQWAALNNNLDWTAVHLTQFGREIAANSQHCPRTMDLLSRLPQPGIAGCSPNAVFSVLAPHTHIPAHSGVTNTRLLCHLPLIVPPGCWFRVGAETREWVPGKAFVFDDTIEHEASNPTDELRVVLIFDIWHPGLSQTEQAAVRALLEAEAQGAALAL